MTKFQILMRLLHELLPLLFAFGFYTSAYLVRENEMLSAMFMLIGTMWLVVSKLDDIHTKIVSRELIVNVNNPPGIVSRIEVNGKPVN